MFKALLVNRSHYLGYRLTHSEENNHGWVGGSAPIWFVDKAHLLTDTSENVYGFFLTIRLPIANRMVSIFVPERFSVYENGRFPCNIKLFEHPISTESQTPLFSLMPEKPAPGEKLTKYQKGLDYSKPVINKAYIAPFVQHSVDTSRPFEDFIQFGGRPAWIQDEEDYYANTLLGEGYSYVMQINEDQYLPDMINGNYPFCFGALYLYAQVGNDALSNLTAAFWQK